MRRFELPPSPGLVLLAAIAGCAVDSKAGDPMAEKRCRDIKAIECDRVFRCGEEFQLGFAEFLSSDFQRKYGANKVECLEKLGAACQGLRCEAPMAYDGQVAADCEESVRRAPCTEIYPRGVTCGVCGRGGAGPDMASGGGADMGGGGLKGVGEGPCQSASECADRLCVSFDADGRHNYCTRRCTANSCPVGYFCDEYTYAHAGLSFCHRGTRPAQPMLPTAPPRLPCTADSECVTGLVCAASGGLRDCTLPCGRSEDCLIVLGPFKFALYQCTADQTVGQRRKVCLPDPRCFLNPMSCIHVAM